MNIMSIDLFALRSHIKILEEANPIVAAASSGPDPMAVLGQLFGGGGATPMPVAGLPPFSMPPPAGSEGGAASAQCKPALIADNLSDAIDQLLSFIN